MTNVVAKPVSAMRASRSVALSSNSERLAQATMSPSSPPQGSCAQSQFPYSPDEFIRKLLLVLNEEDFGSVPRKFQEAFGVTLHGTLGERHRDYGYLETDTCHWFAHVHIHTSEPIGPNKFRLFLDFGDGVDVFRFSDPPPGSCLSLESLRKRLQADGWHETVAQWEITFWTYSKGPTAMDVSVHGKSHPDEPLCVSTLIMRRR
jgi:hypothetical protein